MKKFFTHIFLVTMLISASNLFAQINEDFLANLPENIQEDLLKEMEIDPLEENTSYRAPDTRIKTIEDELKNAKNILQNLSDEIYYDQQLRNRNGQLERFGEQFFNSYQSTFSPVNEPNMSADYILDVGDSLHVFIIGEKDSEVETQIARDGSIVMPKIGKLYLAGLTIEAATRHVQDSVARLLFGYSATLTLTELRAMSILVIGEIEKPGMYTIAGGSIPLAALHAAGGIGEKGSYRKISHKRNNQLIQNLDLYDLFVEGNSRPDKNLRSGDVIVVHPYENNITITGGISRPAIYESRIGETMLDIVNFAGGPQDASSGSMTLELHESENFQSFELNFSDLVNYPAVNNSVLKINQFVSMSNGAKFVTIDGSVKNPGRYTLRDEETLSQLVRRAGGYSSESQEFRGIFSREEAKQKEAEINKRNYQQMITFLSTSPNAAGLSSNSTSLGLILSEFKSIQPIGRVSVEFDLTKIERNATLDTTLADGDSIYIPAQTQDVMILGEVVSPGGRRYNSEFSVADYLDSSGGLGGFADKSRIVIISPNGEAKVYTKRPLFGLGGRDEILPGTLIYVPREIGRLDGVNLAGVIAPIVSSIALSLASLNSIN